MKKNILVISLFFCTVQLHAQPASKIVTDKWRGSNNCDNTAVDEFVGAENRSATPCEIAFDKFLRSNLQKAFEKIISGWSPDWILSDNSSVEIKPVKGVGRGSENQFYRLALSDAGWFYIELSMNPTSPAFSEWYGLYNASMEQWRTNPNETNYKKLTDMFYRLRHATNIRIYVSTNDYSHRVAFLKSGIKQVSVPGAYAVRASYVGALTGGGEENSVDACLIYLGKPKAVINLPGDGMQELEVKNIFPANASKLTVQQLAIRIECNAELQELLLKDIDFSVLQSLISK